MVSVFFLLSLDLMVCMFLDTVFPVVGKRVIKHFPEVSCVDNKGSRIVPFQVMLP